MKDLSKNVSAHLFVCCRSRDEKACCASKGSEELVSQLKSWIKENQLKDSIKVSKSSCLGHCESGITACLYPQNQWFENINENDLPEIKKMLLDCAK